MVYLYCNFRSLEGERFDKTFKACFLGIHCGLLPRVMVDQREALAATTGVTDTVYLVRPTVI